MNERSLTARQTPAATAPGPASSPRAAARLLEYRRGAFVAFAPQATIALVDGPEVVPVPGAPYYCPGLIPWQDQRVPLLDLHALLRAYADGEPAPTGHVLVLAWQPVPGAPLAYGAVCARSLVQTIEVGDEQACELPADSDLWPWIAIACFEHEGRAVPVIDAGRLFAELQR